MKILKQNFFDRPTLRVAEELLGCSLCRKIGKKIIRLEITETEAYDGPEDKASHVVRSRNGKYEARETSRNAPMFGEAGYWYVYFTYGIHWMLNVTTGPKGYPAAVLIRGTKEVSGPARLTKFLQIDERFNVRKADVGTGLWIEKGAPLDKKKIQRTPRIGVAYAGLRWASKPFRFAINRESSSARSGVSENWKDGD